jgi:hypothetical protein
MADDETTFIFVATYGSEDDAQADYDVEKEAFQAKLKDDILAWTRQLQMTWLDTEARRRAARCGPPPTARRAPQPPRPRPPRRRRWPPNPPAGCAG